MNRLAPCLFALSLCALPALAEGASPFASCWAFSGSLPPDYAWAHSVTFTTDHRVAVTRCKGYAKGARAKAP